MTEKQTQVETNDQDMEFLNGTPTRMEVANYVNGILEEKFMPSIQETINSMNSGYQILLALLIKKGLTSEDELKSIKEEFMKIKKEKEEETK